MPDKPSAEIDIDEELVRRLLIAQAPDSMATLPLHHAADGWDCTLWRLGDDLAVRLPRRAQSAALIRHEQQALPRLARAIEATGVRIPLPKFSGGPSDFYPWSWSVVPWFDGARGIDVARAARATWSAPLAGALEALHRPAPAHAPINAVRGVPLADRARAVATRSASLRSRAIVDDALLDRAEQQWARALRATSWNAPAVWIHGDLHPGNLIAREGRLIAMIDFGDITSGDPAYDLAIAWLAFDAVGRRAFIDATDDRYDAATWTRAQGWAAAFAITLVEHSDDDPDYARLGLGALHELSRLD